MDTQRLLFPALQGWNLAGPVWLSLSFVFLIFLFFWLSREARFHGRSQSVYSIGIPVGLKSFLTWNMSKVRSISQLQTNCSFLRWKERKQKHRGVQKSQKGIQKMLNTKSAICSQNIPYPPRFLPFFSFFPSPLCVPSLQMVTCFPLLSLLYARFSFSQIVVLFCWKPEKIK